VLGFKKNEKVKIKKKFNRIPPLYVARRNKKQGQNLHALLYMQF
jgi:hypothetical protein